MAEPIGELDVTLPVGQTKVDDGSGTREIALLVRERPGVIFVLTHTATSQVVGPAAPGAFWGFFDSNGLVRGMEKLDDSDRHGTDEAPAAVSSVPIVGDLYYFARPFDGTLPYTSTTLKLRVRGLLFRREELGFDTINLRAKQRGFLDTLLGR